MTIQTNAAEHTAPARGEVRAVCAVLQFPADPYRWRADRLLRREYGITFDELELLARSARVSPARHLAPVS